MNEENKDLLKILGVIIGVIIVIALSINGFVKSQTKKSCEVFSQQSNRETKYVEYTFWRYDCLTPQDGGWISAYNLRGIE